MNDVIDWIANQLVKAEQSPYPFAAAKPAERNGRIGRSGELRSVIGFSERSRRGPAGIGAVRRGPRARWVAAAAVLVAAVIAALVLGTNGSGPQNAFAGWSATPTRPAPGQLQAAEAACTQLHSAPRRLAALTGEALDWEAPTIADTRGPFTLLFYVARAGTLSCIAGWPSGGVAGSGTRYLLPTPRRAAPDTISAISGGSSSAHGEAWSQLQGQVGSGVTAVRLTLSNGSEVRASVSNGWFVAWWPGTGDAQSAEIISASAITTKPLHCETVAKHQHVAQVECGRRP
jgi:hypothetical protein